MDYTIERLHIFSGINKNDAEKMIKCLHAEYREYEKNEIVLLEGSQITKIGIVLSGHARSSKTDASGKSVIISLLEEGSYIGVLLAASFDRKSPVTVQATERLSVLFFRMEQAVGICGSVCQCHKTLLLNLFDGIAEKALALHDRNDCLIKQTIRDKALTFLTRVANEKVSRSFMVPLDRKAMAEYLNVDRSALSRELSNMKKDGLIDFYKNSFKLLV